MRKTIEIYKAIDNFWYIWITREFKWISKDGSVSKNYDSGFKTSREAIQFIKNTYDCKRLDLKINNRNTYFFITEK